jgi:3-phosphoshikimate 1-carboxyvinyltransferase
MDPRSVKISAPDIPIDVRIELPRSKSISNRALIIGAVAGSTEGIQDLSDADDTVLLHQSLREKPAIMDCGAGGTTFRFLLAWAAIQAGEKYSITGIPRLLERPHRPLIDALIQLGAVIENMPNGFRVKGKKLCGGKVILDSPVSSQFISALLMIAPLMEEGLVIEWQGRRLSEPYVEMTCKLMRHFGAQVDLHTDRIEVRPGSYKMVPFRVPPDWSAASFWFQIAASAPGARIELMDLLDDGSQGDSVAVELWERWVITEQLEDRTILNYREPTKEPHEYQADLTRCPDLFQPLICTCAAHGIAATISGLHNLPLKESDRLADTAMILEKFGLRSNFAEGTFQLEAGQPGSSSTSLDPKEDHRMAMALAPFALKAGPIVISDAAVVNKSYPYFWNDLQRAGFRIERY